MDPWARAREAEVDIAAGSKRFIATGANGPCGERFVDPGLAPPWASSADTPLVGFLAPRARFFRPPACLVGLPREGTKILGRSGALSVFVRGGYLVNPRHRDAGADDGRVVQEPQVPGVVPGRHPEISTVAFCAVVGKLSLADRYSHVGIK